MQVISFSNYSLAFGDDFDFGGSGGGSPENNITYAFNNMHSFIESFIPYCHPPYCKATVNEKFDLIEIARKASEYSSQIHNLHFCYKKNGEFQQDCKFKFNSSEDNSEIKKPNKPHRTMGTLGGTIYINGEQLYKKDGEIAITFPEIVSLMLHEFGHLIEHEGWEFRGLDSNQQHTDWAHTYLDHLGSFIREYLNVYIVERNLDTFVDRKISFRYIGLPLNQMIQGDLVVHVDQISYNITNVLQSSIYSYLEKQKDERIKNFCDFELGDRMLTFNLGNFSFDLSQGILKALRNGVPTNLIIKTDALVTCQMFDPLSTQSNPNHFINGIKVVIPIKPDELTPSQPIYKLIDNEIKVIYNGN